LNLGGDGDDFGFARGFLPNGLEFGLSLQPVGLWIARRAIALKIDVIGAKSDLFVGWF